MGGRGLVTRLAGGGVGGGGGGRCPAGRRGPSLLQLAQAPAARSLDLPGQPLLIARHGCWLLVVEGRRVLEGSAVALEAGLTALERLEAVCQRL